MLFVTYQKLHLYLQLIKLANSWMLKLQLGLNVEGNDV